MLLNSKARPRKFVSLSYLKKQCWYNPDHRLPESYLGIRDLIHLFNCRFQDFEQGRQQTQTFANSFAAPIAYVSPDFHLELIDLQRVAFREKTFLVFKKSI